MLDRYDERNRAAADRAVATLRERIEARRARVKPFIDDVQSWRTTFGVIKPKVARRVAAVVARRPLGRVGAAVR